MFKRLFFIAVTAVCIASCGNKTEETAEKVDTIPMLAQQIQECSKLYSAEYRVHKVVTHSDTVKLKGKLFGENLNIAMPGGKRKIAIPINATLKAYVDFSKVKESDIRRNGNKIEIVLPQPEVVLTASSIDHDAIKQYVSLFRSNFSDEELSAYEQKGRQAIINDIPKLGIRATAQRSAATHLIPIISRLGFKEEDVTITFEDGNSLIRNME